MEKIEDKLRACLDQMRNSLSKEEGVAFKDFWDAKRHCLELFKENLTARVRSLFWTEYSELSSQMRKYKEVVDTESSFAKEQIELAIDSLEKQVQELNLTQCEIPLPKEAKALKQNWERYLEGQKLVIAFAPFLEKVTDLRDELIKTPLKMRTKNQFFKRLSVLGDQLFPKRKEQIKQLADLFKADVEKFLAEGQKQPLFAIKEEVKALQSFAKWLIMPPSLFNELREKLSGVWEKIKDKEQEQKSVAAVKKAEIQAKEQQQQEQEKKAVDSKKAVEQKRQTLLQQISDTLNQAEGLPLAQLVEKWRYLIEESKELFHQGFEKTLVDVRLATIADHIEEKRFYALTDAELQELPKFLEERQSQLRKIKENLERYRKILGGSGLSIEQSIGYQELINEERMRLASVETMIEEIEEKLEWS